ncbi:hypothetical protein SpCBS45565_g05739 [Spizellomyces sp. 'palustris']|nr:hypothetical protein SpCBS45565_g05739 [Spizellomyces sp. 'palustris']
MSPAYHLAWADEPFLLRDDLRPPRLQLEYTKPEKILAEAGIDSTIIIFGSARIRDPEHAETGLQAAEAYLKEKGEDDVEAKERVRVAKKMLESVKYYEAAKEFAMRKMHFLGHARALVAFPGMAYHSATTFYIPSIAKYPRFQLQVDGVQWTNFRSPHIDPDKENGTDTHYFVVNRGGIASLILTIWLKK